MGQFVHNGVLYEELPGGHARVIGPASGGAPSAFGPTIGGNPAAEDRAQSSDARAAADERRRAAEWNASHNPDGSPKVQAPSLLGDPSKSGPEYLATLPQNIRGRVQQLLDGRSMLTAREKGQPLGQQLMDAANQADPTFDETASHARYTERQQYTGMGKGSQVVQAAERLAQHVNDLYGASKALGGPDLGWAPLSNIANAGTNSFRQAKVASYNQILPLISGELQKLTKVGAATVDESNKIEHNLRADQPEDVRYAAIKELVRLGRAQYDPLRESWAAAWQGSTPPPMPMDFSKPTTAIFDNIESGGQPLEMKRDGAGNLIMPGADNSDAAVQAEVKARIAHGEDPAATIQWLTSLGRPPSKDTIAAILANRGNQSPDVRPPQPGSYGDSYLSQGMSGANEGLAGVLGAPVDLMTGAMNLIPKGINAVANTNIPTIQDPFGGSQSFKQGLSDIGSILPGSDDPSKQFVRRVGQSVGAAAVPGMFAGSLPKMGAALLSGVGGGVGGATAQQIAPGNPLAEFAGETLGGGLAVGGLAKASQRAAQREIGAAVPTVDELKQMASNLYSKAEQRGVTASPEQTQQLASDFHKTLLNEGQIGPNGSITNADTNTSKAFNLIQQYAGKEMTPKQMNTVRAVLADSRQSADASDRRLGGMLLNQFDDFVSPLAPEFDKARAISSRYLQAQDLEKARELAAARASQFTGSGFENALRTEYRGLDRNGIKGNNHFSPDVTDAIQTVARGTPASNFFRGLGRLAPTGPVSAMGDVLPAMAVGSMTDPVTGGMFGAGLAGAGIAGRTVATRMGIHAADQAELIARNGGALDQASLIPHDLRRFYAELAAAQQAKYLSGN